MYCSQVYFFALERAGAYDAHTAVVFQTSALLLPLAPTVETRATELRISSRCPRRHLVRAGLAIAAATVFLDRAAQEQRSTFYTGCCCRATYELANHFLKLVRRTSSCSFYSSKEYTWLQYKKSQNQVPRTAFSTFDNEVRLEGGHGNCCRLATLTGVHQGAPICLAKFWFEGKFRS